MRHDNRTPYRRPTENKFKKLWVKNNRISATATRETQFGEVDVPTIKLSTAFLVILFLHLALIAGVMIFRMLDRTEIAEAGAGNTSAPAAPAAPTARNPSAPTTATTPAATPAATTATTTPAASPADTRVSMDPATPPEMRRHIVRNRESLDGIAAQYGVSREAIIQANGLGNSKPFAQNMELQIPLPPREIRAERPGGAARASDPEVRPARPVAGAPVAVPPATVITTTTTTTTVPVATSGQIAASAGGPGTHTVQPGETLWGISRVYNITANALMQANGITDPAKLQTGTVLRIP